MKVDREERPDVDAIYMQAVQAMTGSGGWPMTVFLDPDGRPFFGGTYFPNDDRQGMPGFVRVMDAVDEAWRERRDELARAGRAAARRRSPAAPRSAPRRRRGDRARADDPRPRRRPACTRSSTRASAASARAPKFPQAMTLDVPPRRRPSRDADAARRSRSITVSLDAMAAGGMYDQVGGGFHRYSVDAYWLVPHFEKMLYDQALLARAYLHGWLVTGEPRYRRVVEETIEYVLRDLRHADGGFFSAEDADSEGVEGKFYVWSLEEIEELLRRRRPRGDPLLRRHRAAATSRTRTPATAATSCTSSTATRTVPTSSRGACPGCSPARAQRVRPGLDDKVLLGWNALFLRSLAEAAVALERDDWMDAARTNAAVPAPRAAPRRRPAAALVAGRARRTSSRTPRTTPRCSRRCSPWPRSTTSRGSARRATVADELVRLFADDERGGFFTTGTDAEALIVRPKDYQDNATPSENSLAADGLLRLAALTGDAADDGTRRRWVAHAGAGARRAPHRVRVPARRARARRHARRSRSRSSATPTTPPPTHSSPSCTARLLPASVQSWSRRRGAAPTSRRCSPIATTVDGSADRVRVRALRLPSSPSPTRDARPNRRSAREPASTAGVSSPADAGWCRATSGRGEAVGEGLGHRPAVRDDRLAVGGVDLADQLDGDLAAGLHRRGRRAPARARRGR